MGAVVKLGSRRFVESTYLNGSSVQMMEFACFQAVRNVKILESFFCINMSLFLQKTCRRVQMMKGYLQILEVTYTIEYCSGQSI